MPRRKLKTFLFSSIMAVCLSGCVNFDYPTAKPLPNLNFSNLQPYRLGDGGANVVAVVYKNQETIEIERELGFSPSNIMTRYLINRFDTLTPQKTLMVQIEKADLTKKTEKTGPLEFMVGMTKDYYTMDIEVALYPLTGGKRQSPYTLKLHQELVVSETVTLAERERKFFEWMETAVTKMDAGIGEIVRNNF